ncbi:MAG: ABC transporter ATP-binding protein [Oscillospiraceae bacterium]|nr:ABC transporter ATP-binding protein [Oscillospiraceae bacterium]
MTAVETFSLSKQYKHTLAVDHVSLRVPEGVKCGFLGKNGAGKTTTIKMLMGLKKPTSGGFSIMGEEQVFGRRNLAVGYLPDVPNFYSYMTGAEFLDLCGRLYDIPAAKRKEQVQSLLKRVGLDKARGRISTYSRGMKQRLGIAQAMINNPSIIFMDEPISALDPMGRRDVMDIVQSLTDTTVVFSTHILSDVEDICDYILIIEKGRILVQDSLAGLKASHAKDMAKVTLYEAAHGEALRAALGRFDYLSVQADSPVELAVSSDTADTAAISRAVSSALTELSLPFERFVPHSPTLEDIFAETIRNGVSTGA